MCKIPTYLLRKARRVFNIPCLDEKQPRHWAGRFRGILAAVIWITPHLSIDESELQWDFIRAAGPGGQNVNKVSSAVQLRFNLLENESLPPEVKERLIRMAGKRINEKGELIIQAQRRRTQEQNRQEALERLILLLQQASQKPKPRHPTHPSAAARQARLNAKRRRSQLKALRQKREWEWE